MHHIATSDPQFDTTRDTTLGIRLDSRLDISGLAAQIAERGIESCAASGRLDAFVRAARSAGASPTLVALVADPAEPAVARERAFGLLAVAIAADRASPRRRAA
jgi:hypothetical protein